MASTSHILRFGHQYYAIPSISAATKLIELLSKLESVEHITQGECNQWFYTPESDQNHDVRLMLNQPYFKPSKSPRLPAPKRGSRRCPCGHSDVSPGGRCPSCGAEFGLA